MKRKKGRQENRLLLHLVFSLLPVQVLVVAMGSVNSLVDGVVASRCIAAEMVGVVGLYYSLLRIMEAINAVLLGGSSVLCGRYMGSGRVDRTSGVWFSILLGILVTAVIPQIYSIFCCGFFPGNMTDWLLLSQVFPEKGKRYAVTLTRLEEVAPVAEQIQSFCEKNQIGHTTARNAALCMEEMALNIFQHGFPARRRYQVIIREDTVLLRIKDNGIPFNPEERAALVREDSPYKNIGTRIVHGLASQVSYQNLMGLNVLTIEVGRHA